MDLVSPNRICGAIEVFDSAITNCDEMLSIFLSMADTTWARGRINESEISPSRTSDMTFIDLTSLRNPTIIFQFARTLFLYLDEYGKRYNVGFSGMEHACLNRYQIGQEYKVHPDAGPGVPRIFSALLYMNDVSEGGETYFPLFDTAITPKAGRLVIFPSDYAYAHQARAPISNVKYSLAVWVHRMP